jgi:hypothetical protein
LARTWGFVILRILLLHGPYSASIILEIAKNEHIITQDLHRSQKRSLYIGVKINNLSILTMKQKITTINYK